MATLIDNVWLDGHFYGPDHGNADAVPDDLATLVPDHAWDAPRRPVPEVIDGIVAMAPLVPTTDDRAELIAWATAQGLDVNVRLTLPKLQSQIARLLAEATS